jgi:hypothetical protein
MKDTNSDLPNSEARPQGFAHWLSLSGLITIAASVFAFLLLFLADLFTGTPNPYVGILTYLIAPMFSTLGVVMVVVGFWLRRREFRLHGGQRPLFLDLDRLRERRILGWFVGGGSAFLLITAVGSYHSYHFTESVTFCGQACHTVMEPEFVTYQHSPHARVSCVECHIGPGAQWFVKAKLSGLYQVYATLANKYPRPIPTPIKNLRPARDTCEQCHWPEKFSGDFVRTYHHFLSDDENTEYSVRLLLKVGGGNPERGPVSGIHWHIANVVEYYATDDTRQEIPWVRYTDATGKVIEYRTDGFDEAIDPAQIRQMDCMDCHNRPSHIYKKPNDAVDLAIAGGRIDRELPLIRSRATELLVGDYATVEDALRTIDETLRSEYPGEPRILPAIQAVQQIYRENFFPLMKANWRAYPENLGHKDWPGCVRCHDDQHKSADDLHVISFQNCNACHLILAQGPAEDLEKPSMSGQEFQHPGDPWDPDFRCHDCHTGGP